MKTTTHGNGNRLDDLYILPESPQERAAIVSWLKDHGCHFKHFVSDVEGQEWHGKQCLEVLFGCCLAEELQEHLETITSRELFTALDHRDDRCDHHQYWSQFVTPAIRSHVENRIGLERLLGSTDEHLNDIPLAKWDAMDTSIRQMVDVKTWKHCHNATYGEADKDKFLWSLSCGVCIAKAAARMIIADAR